MYLMTCEVFFFSEHGINFGHIHLTPKTCTPLLLYLVRSFCLLLSNYGHSISEVSTESIFNLSNFLVRCLYDLLVQVTLSPDSREQIKIALEIVIDLTIFSVVTFTRLFSSIRLSLSLLADNFVPELFDTLTERNQNRLRRLAFQVPGR